MQAYFNGFTITMTKDQALATSRQGQCDRDVEELSHNPKIRRQLDTINRKDLQDELREYGAWELSELHDHEENLQRILWIAAGDIKEALHERGEV